MPRTKLRLPRFFARLLGREPTVYELTKRINRAAESILGNERLTADLDDAAANALLNWGVACAEMIAGSTAGLNDAEAEKVLSLRLRSTRRLMRSVNKWIAKRGEMDAEGSAELLAKIVEQATVIYGEAFALPDDDRRDVFLKQELEFSDDPPQMISNLRDLLENLSHTSTHSQGENDDQEKHKQEIHSENDN